MPSSASAAVRSKYGKYLPHQRFNVDQVPLPFINGMDETYEEVGAKPWPSIRTAPLSTIHCANFTMVKWSSPFFVLLTRAVAAYRCSRAP